MAGEGKTYTCETCGAEVKVIKKDGPRPEMSNSYLLRERDERKGLGRRAG